MHVSRDWHSRFGSLATFLQPATYCRFIVVLGCVRYLSSCYVKMPKSCS